MWKRLWVLLKFLTPVVLSSIELELKSDGDKRVCCQCYRCSVLCHLVRFGTNYTYQINAEPVSAAPKISRSRFSRKSAGTYTITVLMWITGL